MPVDPSAPWAGIVLAGGTGARLGGADKSALEYDGRTLLEHALDAVLDAREVVVVGLPVPTGRPVTFVREEPAGGGPAAGLLAGVGALLHRPAAIGVLAVDMPRVSPVTFRRLRDAAAGHDGAFLADPGGRRQLAGIVSSDALAGVDPGLEGRHNLPLRRLLDPLDLVLVAPVGDEAIDIDSWADVRDLRSGLRHP